MANRKLAECFLRQLMASMSIITLMGCAGEEVDFSKPPMEIAGGSKPKVDAKDVSAENAASTSPSQRSEPSKQPTDLGSNASSGVSQAPITDSKRQEIQQPLDDPTDDSQPPPPLNGFIKRSIWKTASQSSLAEVSTICRHNHPGWHFRRQARTAIFRQSDIAARMGKTDKHVADEVVPVRGFGQTPDLL